MIQWAAIYDVDEFLVLKKHKTIGGLVKDHCPVDQGCGGLVLNWYIFQSNGETAYSPIPITQRFTSRFPLTVKETKMHGPRHTSIKSIVHVESYDSYQSPHCHTYLYNRTAYDTSGAVNCKVHEKENSKPKDDVAILHHYRTKSRREFLHRCERGRADFKARRKNHDSVCPKWYEDSPDDIFDDTAWQVLKENVPAYKVYDQEGAKIFG